MYYFRSLHPNLPEKLHLAKQKMPNFRDFFYSKFKRFHEFWGLHASLPNKILHLHLATYYCFISGPILVKMYIFGGLHASLPKKIVHFVS